MTEIALGIDLGTTNCCVAVVRDGKTEIIPHPGGGLTIPSMIWVGDEGETLVGQAAKKKFLSHPEKTIYGAKRLMGRRFGSDEMDDIKSRFYYEIAQNDDGEAVVKAGSRYLSLIDVGAVLLEYLKNAARDYLGFAVDSAVVSVPAYFKQGQREAVKRAAEQAGLDVLRIVNEPTAAAVAYGIGKTDDQRILVYDLGGGTFDVTVLHINDQVYKVEATGGDSFLGGIDFDNQLVSYFVNLIKKRNGVDVTTDNSALQRLRASAESAKIDLTTTEAALVSVPFLLPDDGNGNPLDFEHRITRDMFEEMARPIVLRTLKIVNGVLKDAGIGRQDVDELVFVGGMTRAPVVSQILSKHFGKQPRKDVHPDEVVAQGAAILANATANSTGEIQLLDVLPVSIGFAVDENPYETAIGRNTGVPYETNRSFRTSHDHQTGATVRVFQGESNNASENEYLGGLSIAGFPPRPAGEIEYEITFSLDQDSILLVTASGGGRQVFSQYLTEKMVEKETEKPAVLDLDADDIVPPVEYLEPLDAKQVLKETVQSALTSPDKNPEPEPAGITVDDMELDNILDGEIVGQSAAVDAQEKVSATALFSSSPSPEVDSEIADLDDDLQELLDEEEDDDESILAELMSATDKDDGSEQDVIDESDDLHDDLDEVSESLEIEDLEEVEEGTPVTEDAVDVEDVIDDLESVDDLLDESDESLELEDLEEFEDFEDMDDEALVVDDAVEVDDVLDDLESADDLLENEPEKDDDSIDFDALEGFLDEAAAADDMDGFLDESVVSDVVAGEDRTDSGGAVPENKPKKRRGLFGRGKK